jgi:hypothetical protein
MTDREREGVFGCVIFMSCLFWNNVPVNMAVQMSLQHTISFLLDIYIAGDFWITRYTNFWGAFILFFTITASIYNPTSSGEEFPHQILINSCYLFSFSIYLSLIYLSIYLSVCLSIYLSISTIFLSICFLWYQGWKARPDTW